MGKFVCLLVVLAVIETSMALKCYHCGVVGGTKCGDKLEDKLLSDCQQVVNQESVCAKIVTNGAVERKCEAVPKGTEMKCTKANDKETCYCNGDKCNSAPSINLSYFAVVGLFVAYFAPKMFVH